MNVALFGASGNVGSRILQELITRGHHVVAIARDTSKITASENVLTRQDDLSDPAKAAEVMRGCDAVVSAYAPPQADPDQLIGTIQRLIEAVRTSGIPRLVVVGGAGSLNVGPGITLLRSGYLPEAFRPIAAAHDKALKVLRSSDIDWTCFSPAAYFEPGARTAKFRLGLNQLIRDGKGESRISMEDYAVALVDELEKPAHRKQRFTIGY